MTFSESLYNVFVSFISFGSSGEPVMCIFELLRSGCGQGHWNSVPQRRQFRGVLAGVPDSGHIRRPARAKVSG